MNMNIKVMNFKRVNCCLPEQFNKKKDRISGMNNYICIGLANKKAG